MGNCHDNAKPPLLIFKDIPARYTTTNAIPNSPIDKATEISRKIEDQLVKDHKAMEKVIKLLLLGPSESGKSTVLKQMRIIHLNGFSTDELWARRSLIFMNVVDATAQLLNGSRRLGFKLSPEREDDTKKVFDSLAANDFSQNFPPNLLSAIKNLWSEPIIQETYHRRNEFYLMDCATYFIESVDRIAEPDYIPTTHDILFSRVETIGVSEIRYTYKNTEFRIFDVGGQKTQRRKWIHLFDNVNALFYIAAISEYDQVLREDGVTNRLQDALLLFKSIGNNDVFRNVQIILFLNKKDLFAEKVKKIPLTACFSNYKYKNDYKNGTIYITRKFEQQIFDKQKMIYTHLTCATDTDHVQFVMNSVTDMIIAENFKQTGVI